MFRISLKAVGAPLRTEDIVSEAGTIEYALRHACQVCRRVLRDRLFTVEHLADNEYVLTDGGVPLGSFTITKVD